MKMGNIKGNKAVEGTNNAIRNTIVICFIWLDQQ